MTSCQELISNTVWQIHCFFQISCIKMLTIFLINNFNWFSIKKWNCFSRETLLEYIMSSWHDVITKTLRCHGTLTTDAKTKLLVQTCSKPVKDSYKRKFHKVSYMHFFKPLHYKRFIYSYARKTIFLPLTNLSTAITTRSNSLLNVLKATWFF